jgi:four helix bundle protein
MQDFRRLLVWSRSHALATTIRRTVHGFRGAGYAELKSQLVSAAESIPSNVVEGCGAATSKEFARFLDISIKSTSEVEYRLELARSMACSQPLSGAGCRPRQLRFGKCSTAFVEPSCRRTIPTRAEGPVRAKHASRAQMWMLKMWMLKTDD